MAGSNFALSAFLLHLLLVWRVGGIASDAEIFMRLAALQNCEGANFVPGEQVCYQVSLQLNFATRNFFDCIGFEPMPEDSFPLQFLPALPGGPGGMLTISSPRYPSSYPNDYLCLYSIPPCQDPRSIYYVSWTMGNFQLEDECDFFTLPDVCTDILELITPSDRAKLQAGGATLNDPFQSKTLCGSQGSFFDTSSGPGLFIRFRSSSLTAAMGFQMSFQCAAATDPPPGFEDVLLRRRRSSPHYLPYYTPKPPVQTPKPPIIIPEEGNRVEVPDELFLVYQQNTLDIVKLHDEEVEVLRTFKNISRLFFWTGFNGTRVFITSAPVPLEEIFGGGTLLFVNGCAYYATFNVPPRFVPDDDETTSLNIILGATAIFFPNGTQRVIPGSTPAPPKPKDPKKPGGSDQQQSIETCLALDRLAQQATSLGQCRKNSFCTMLMCTTPNSTYSFTFFPCSSPVAVKVFTNLGSGLNKSISQSTVFQLTPTIKATVIVRQAQGGVRFGLTAVIDGVKREQLPETFVPLTCISDNMPQIPPSQFGSQPVSQQQSNETCDILDTLARQSTALGTCVINQECTMGSCRDSENFVYNFTIFTCTSPIVVNVFTNFGFGLNKNISQTTIFTLSPTNRIIVFVKQIPGGIRYGNTLILANGTQKVLVPQTDIPVRCNLFPPEFQFATQQQSMETCSALDNISEQAQGLGNCSRNGTCTVVTCNSTKDFHRLTIFPCSTPFLVNVFSTFGKGLNATISKTRTFFLSYHSKVVVILQQLTDGIRFGVQLIEHYVKKVLVPITFIPLNCSFDLEAIDVACDNRFSNNTYVRQSTEDFFELFGIFPCLPVGPQ